MGMYKYIRQNWNKPDEKMIEVYKKRLVEWRKQPVTLRIERPTRLDRARALGYKAKQGYVLIRQRVERGGRKRENIRGGRRPKHNRQLKILSMNYQHVAERRAAEKHINCEVLNSYFVGKDEHSFWYEIILVDKNHPSILADDRINWIANPKNTGRVFRGLTSAARKSRGLRSKGKGAEKVR
jgi:large subunit ribosomal protein L15e